jgi:allantoinase
MIARQQEKTSEGQHGQLAPPWALRGDFVITPEGSRSAAVLVHGETIAAVVEPDQVPAGYPIEDVGERVILPGLVDIHVHINEPGRTEWEGFASATRAAAAGGVTTLVDMPLNSSPVTTTVAALRQKQAAAAGKLWVDCGFHGGVVSGNAAQVQPLLDAGVLGMKAFLCPSGIAEFPNASPEDLRTVLPVLARARVPLLVHAELVGPLGPDVELRLASNPRSYAAYLDSRPEQWEIDAIRLLIALAREYNAPIHIVHLSSASAVPLIREARAAGVPLTVETCPHYLTFAAEEIPDADPRYKCAPPIRNRDNRERLWEGLRSDLIDTIGSDHSPCPPELKHLETGDLRRAWGGIASLQLTLPVLCQQVWNRPEVSLVDVVRWAAERPAALLRLAGRKGAVAAGCDADLVVLDLEAEFTVTLDMLYHRHKTTPYEGRCLRGRVEKTFLRGRKIYDTGWFAEQPSGRILARPDSPASRA